MRHEEEKKEKMSERRPDYKNTAVIAAAEAAIPKGCDCALGTEFIFIGQLLNEALKLYSLNS